MTALFHGPPTRGPVMHFCESEGGGRDRNVGQLARALYPSHVYLEVLPRARAAVYRADCATFCVTGQSQQSSTEANARRGTPLDQSEACSRERVHTDTWLGYAVHVSRSEEVEHCCCVKCKCRTDTPNPGLTHGNRATVGI